MAQRKTPEQKLAELSEQREKIETQLRQKKKKLQREENRQRARMQNEQRKLETRRKILVGAAVLHEIEQSRWSNDQLQKLLDGFLDRDDDRALFGLAKLEQEKKSAVKAAAEAAESAGGGGGAARAGESAD